MSNKLILQSYNDALNANNLDLQSLIEQANALPDVGSIELPVLTNEGFAPDLLSGKQLIDQEGNIVTGTMPIVDLATPTIWMNYDTGAFSAQIIQDTGYVNGGVKISRGQLDVQAAKTITPTKSSQTAVASGRYTTGAVTVAAIPSEYITTTDATASADEIMSGETAYVNGSKVTGTFSIDNELSTQDNLIAQIQTAVDSLPEAGDGSNSDFPYNIIVNSNCETDWQYTWNKKHKLLLISIMPYDGYPADIQSVNVNGNNYSIDYDYSVTHLGNIRMAIINLSRNTNGKITLTINYDTSVPSPY